MRILIVVAHPDDEVCFFWPILQQADAYEEVGLITACQNKDKGEGPLWALRNVCAVNGVELLSSPLEKNQFYRRPTRYEPFTLMGGVQAIEGAIQMALTSFRPDVIFTHNPWGEYGHGDHRLLFNIVARLNFPMLLTDICIENQCHPSSKEIPLFYRPLFQNPIRSCTLDRAWYDKMQAIYERSNAWTWGGHEPVTEASLYRV